MKSKKLKVLALDENKNILAKKLSETNAHLQSDEKYHYMFTNNPQPMWIYDLETLSFLEVNDAAVNHYGYSREEFLSMTLKDIRPAEDIDALMKDVEITRKTYNPSGEWRHLKKNGELIIVEIISHTITFNNRKARHVMVNDITKRKLSDEKLQESEERFRKIFEEGSMGMAMASLTTGKLIGANKEFCDMLGYTEAEMKQLTFIHFTHPDDREKDINGLKSLSEGQIKKYNTEKRYIKKNGEVIWAFLSLTKISDTEGKPGIAFAMIKDITERKQAQEVLREREYLLSASQRAAHIGTWSWKVGDTTTYWSDETYRIYGLNPDMGPPSYEFFFEIIHPEDRLKMQEWPTKIIAGLRPPPIEFRVLRPDGIYRVIQTDGDVIETMDGVPSRIAGTAYDITERKLAEKELRDSQEKFRLAFDSSPDSIAITRVSDGVFVDANIGFTKISGYSKEEVIGKSSSEIGSWKNPDDRNKFAAMFMSKGEVRDFEAQLLTRNGEITGLMTASIIELNGIPHVLGITRDITELKNSEEKIRENLNLLRIAGEKAKLGGWNVILGENRSYWSDEVAAIHEMPAGYSPLVEEGISFYAPEWRAKIKEVFSRCASEGVSYDEEMEILTSSGKRIWIRTIGEAVRDNNGKIFKIQGAFQDITDRKKAEEDIRLLNEQLEQRVAERTSQLEAANKELEAFSYSVSHDLRSPLRHINGFAEILSKQYSENLPEDALRHLNTITGAAKKMGALIDDLLSFSRTGRAELKKTTFNMNRVVDEAQAQIKPSITNRNIVWHISQLPEIYGDYNLLRQVWINLIDNAVKYTRTKENAVIDIGSYEEGKENIFFIKDNGVGFDMKYADKLFGVFQRLHSSSQFDGTGVGLANVQRIILRHGGKVWAEAESEMGAAFYYSIPKLMEDKI